MGEFVVEVVAALKLKIEVDEFVTKVFVTSWPSETELGDVCEFCGGSKPLLVSVGVDPVVPELKF